MKSILALLLTLVIDTWCHAAPILVNGDFEAPPILGAGQTVVPVGSVKFISTSPTLSRGYSTAISGITGWTYATPFDGGTHSDHGLARRNGSFGLPTSGQSAFINNWDRLVSQTVTSPHSAGDRVTATIDFGTLGSATDAGRAGRFFLVAGEADPVNLDRFSARSIILGQVSVANPTWSLFTPNITVGNGSYVPLTLTYTYRLGDAALNLPLTIGFRTVTSSVGPTYWDNAALNIQAVPEPGSLLVLGSAFGVALLFRRTTRGGSGTGTVCG